MKYKILTTKKYYKFFTKLDLEKQAVIRKRLTNINLNGVFGDYKVLDRHLYELRIFSHGGIRVYYSILSNDTIVLLLNGGLKESKEQQQKDINDAKKELENFNKNILGKI